MEWFVAGGFIMWILLVLGAIALLNAGAFARDPDPSRLPRIDSLLRSVAWTTAVGVATDFAAVGTKIPENPAWAKSPDLPLLVLQGFAESMSPLILGGMLISACSLLVGAGHGRLRARGIAP